MSTSILHAEYRFAVQGHPDLLAWVRTGLAGVPGVQAGKRGDWYRASYDAVWLVEAVFNNARASYPDLTWTVQVPDVHHPRPFDPVTDALLTQTILARHTLRPWLVTGGGDFQLLPFQREALWFALERNGGFLDEAPGAGKTVQSTVFAELGPPGPVLIVTKNPVTTQFCRAIHQFCRAQTLDMPPASQAPIRNGARLPLAEVLRRFFLDADYDDVIHDYTNGRPYVVVGWDTLTSVRDALLAVRWSTVVFDESHLGKSQERFVWSTRLQGGMDATVKTNNRAAVAWELAEACPRRLAMTGTPQPDRRRDWHSQLSLVSTTAWGKAAGPFNKRYCDAKDGENGWWDTSGTSNTDEFLYRKSYYVHKVPQSVVDAQLPRRRLDVRFVSSREQDTTDAWFRKESARLAKLSATGDKSARQLLEEVQLQEAGARKVSFTVDLVETHLAISKDDEGRSTTKGKVVVFTGRHVDCYRMARAIQARVKKRGQAGDVQVWCGVEASGGTEDKPASFDVVEGPERQAMQDAYMKHPGPCVLVATAQAWGTGIDLHDSDLLVVVTLPYSPADFDQWTRRVQRLGMNRPCLVVVPIAEGTVDERRITIFNDKVPDIVVTTGEASLDIVREQLRGDMNAMLDRVEDKLGRDVSLLAGDALDDAI